jgi:hypothetical protein
MNPALTAPPENEGLSYNMSMLKFFCIWPVFLLGGLSLFAQNDWVQRKDKDGIIISTRSSGRSAFNDIRVEMDLPGNVYQLAAILKDADQYYVWSYSVKKSQIINKINPSSFVYYMEVNAPWPVTNRDLYAVFAVSIDTVLQTMHVSTVGERDFRPAGIDLVRIPYSKSQWYVSTISNNIIHLSYVLEIDPGGSVPGWIMNLFSTKAPFETFLNLKHKMARLNSGMKVSEDITNVR